MKNLRIFRIVLTVIFFIASLALLILGPEEAPMAKVALRVQIIPSALASTIGVTLFWLLVSFLFGRFYCSTVCPLGAWQDLAIWIRRKCRPDRTFRFTQPYRIRYDLLFVYLISLLLGISTVCALLEPWPLFSNALAAVNPEDATGQWPPSTKLGGIIGIVVSCIVLLASFVAALFFGRDFCNTYCPIGTALGSMHERTLYHIEIDPDRCTNCMLCEDVCPSHCIKIVSRYVDNSRCVRCLDCIHVCRDEAINLQINRNRRPATPLLRKKKKA